MSIEDLFKIGAGLVVIGLFSVLFDYLMIRLLMKAGASKQETWAVEATLPLETSKENALRYKMTRATMTHRFRRGGIVTVVIGLGVLLGSGLWRLLR